MPRLCCLLLLCLLPLAVPAAVWLSKAERAWVAEHGMIRVG